MRTRSFLKQHQPPKLMLPVVKLGCFWCRYFHEKWLQCLLPYFTASEVTNTKIIWRKSVHRRRICDCSSMGPLCSVSAKTGVPAAPTGLAVDGLMRLGLWHGWFRENTQKTPSASCVLPLLISTGTLPSRLTHPCLAGAGRKSATRKLPWADGLQSGISLRSCGCEKREVSVAGGWLPSPLSRHWASFSPVPFPPQQTVACCQALSCTIRENKYPLHSPLFFCFVLHSFSGLK